MNASQIDSATRTDEVALERSDRPSEASRSSRRNDARIPSVALRRRPEPEGSPARIAHGRIFSGSSTSPILFRDRVQR